MRQRCKELRAEADRGRRANKMESEGAVLAVLRALPHPDRAIGERLRAIIKAHVPDLAPRTWYGMPA